MAKMKEGIVTVLNTENGKKVEAKSTQTPRKNEAGIYAVPKMNILGFAYAQRKYPELTDTKAFEKKLGELLGIPDQGFGSLGNWVTEEDRAKLQVLINGQPFIPSAKTVAPAPEVAVAPPVVDAPVMQPMKAMADTTKPSEDETNVQKILSAIRGGSDQQAIQEALIAKKGQVKATELWNKAVQSMRQLKPQEQKQPEQPVAAPVIAKPEIEAPATTPTFDLGL